MLSLLMRHNNTHGAEELISSLAYRNFLVDGSIVQPDADSLVDGTVVNIKAAVLMKEMGMLPSILVNSQCLPQEIVSRKIPLVSVPSVPCLQHEGILHHVCLSWFGEELLMEVRV